MSNISKFMFFTKNTVKPINSCNLYLIRVVNVGLINLRFLLKLKTGITKCFGIFFTYFFLIYLLESIPNQTNTTKKTKYELKTNNFKNM